tara:strand:+ start:215 stop:829 length:615 start_codon:yes stop_codon:yes gene_type:complete
MNTLSPYQLYTYIGALNDKKNLILEPISTIFRLALLQYKDKGTKLSVMNNSIRYQLPSYDQGILRMLSGDCREDLHNLYHPILKAIDWYEYNEYQYLYDECILGLDLLNNVYEENSTIRHTISHYIAVIQMNDNEDYRKDTKFNPIIDSLKEIWSEAEIKSTISLLRLIKVTKNRDMYLESLELILTAKEQFVKEYLKRITTEY